MNLKLSALDIVPVFEGETALDAFNRTVFLAQNLEEMNYTRFLLAEHHNLGGTACASTSNIIQYVLGKTKTIQVGAGGVMLPNHSPLQVAETYGTLDVLFPGRVNLGIGRAPGTDQITSQLITRKHYVNNSDFLEDIKMIEYFMGPLEQQTYIGAYPGADADITLIILGSSVNSAYVAAKLGLIYSFAGHINPKDAKRAIDIYRQNFKPSKYLSNPYVILGTWLFAADTDEQAKVLYTATQRSFLNMINGENRRKSPKANPNFESELTSSQKILLTKTMGMKLLGSKQSIEKQIQDLVRIYAPEELIAVTSISELPDLIKNYQILKQAVEAV